MADHTPFSKVIEKLAGAFGFEFSNGHVGNAIFRINDNTLMEHAISKGNSDSQQEKNTSLIMQGIMNGASSSERIVQVKTFGGSAFKIPENAEPLLILGKYAVSLMSDIPFQVNFETLRVSMNGFSF